MNEFISAIDQICEEKGISKEKVMETIEMAIAAAYKKDHGLKGQSIRAVFDEKTQGFNIFQARLVIDETMVWQEGEEPEADLDKDKADEIDELEEGEVKDKKVKFNEERHLFLKEAQKLNFSEKKPGVRKTEQDEQKFTIFIATKKKGKVKVRPELGDEVWFALESQKDYGRIAAQTAKQVVIQRIREAEREAVFDEYKSKEGEIISGVVQRVERGLVFVDIGKTGGILFPEEQVAGEYYRVGQRLRFFVVEVKKEARGPAILLSRTRAEMVSRLFEMEVPEIGAGSVEIKAVAREAGSRSKIAVASKEEGVDAIGACVGQKGTRVQAIINELGGEKIDIIEWSEDSEKLIANALSPAKVIEVKIDEEKKLAQVQVPEDQLSLAIGKQGQNVRLAAKLTGWKIDILTEAGEKIEPEDLEEEPKEAKAKEEGLSEEKKGAKEEKEESPKVKKKKSAKKSEKKSKESATKETPKKTKKKKPRDK